MIKADILSEILDKVNDAVLVLDKGRNLLFANKSAVNLIKLKNFEFGKNIFNILSDLEIITLFNKIFEKAEDNFEIKFKDRVLNIRKYLLNDSYKILIISDITASVNYKTFKMELVGNLTHELKTPIALIMNYAETLLLNKDLNDEKKEQFVSNIFESAKRLNDLVSDIILLHKLENESGNFVVKFPFKIQDVVGELKLAYDNGDKSVLFEYDDVEVFINKTHFVSVLSNLIDNAIKYSNGKNVLVNIKKDKIKDFIIISVDDEGPVIPDDELSRIFERFYTRSKSRNKEKAGTGLGLSIVKHISALYNGFVHVYKNRYGGNCFEVILSEKK